MRHTLLIISLLLASVSSFAQTPSFTNVAVSGSGNAGSDVGITAAANGGFSWGDINEDGLLDLVVNTSSNTVGTRILIAQINGDGDHVFVDQTTTMCQHCTTVAKDRTSILADINHDGYLDMIRNDAYTNQIGLMIYLNQGPAAGYAFGVGTSQTPNKSIISADFHDGKMNTEGVFLIDYDHDGWLDIGIENHNYGVDIFSNPKDGTANFTCIDPVAAGLPTSATEGDYSAAADIDDDGDVDFIARKDYAGDVYLNDGDGTFSGGQDLGLADNNNKGGVVFADFDNDGDFDLYWTDDSGNQIWVNDGTGTMVATQVGSDDGEPWLSSGITAPLTGIDGCSAGDVNNDGKLDLFLTANSGTSYLFINNTSSDGTLSFTQNNYGINVNGNGEGCGFADYDNDGDLDLYVNVSGKANQLWQNSLNDGGDNDYLFVEPRIDLGGGVYRAAIGANVVLEDCNGNVVSGIRDVATASGHGTDAPDWVHFGLPSGASEYYTVVVKYITQNGSRTIQRKSIEPSALAGQKIVMNDADGDDTGLCSSFPVEWLGFEGAWEGQQVNLVWLTASESGSDYYDVQRSADGMLFESIGSVGAAGTTYDMSEYQFTDRSAKVNTAGNVYYRLRQVDLNGTINLSSTIELSRDESDAGFLKISPNPVRDILSLDTNWPGEADARVNIFTPAGQQIMNETIGKRELGKTINVDHLPAGVYVMTLQSGGYHDSQRFVIQ